MNEANKKAGKGDPYPLPERDYRTAQSDLTARICWYHFREGQTQQEIADRVGLSRVTINRVISDSLKRGYVNITINTPIGPCLALEAELKNKFSLKEVIVAPSPVNEDEVRTSVGLAAGDYISKTLQQNQILGLSWGGTIYTAARSLQPRSAQGNSVVSLSGGLHRSTIINPYDNAAMFARILDAECYYMTAPMFVDNARVKRALFESKPIQTVLEIAKSIHIALLTAIDLSPKSWIIKHGALTAEMLKNLVAAGSAGGVCDQYLDFDGRLLKHEINERTMTVPIETVRRIPHIVLAAGGSYKVPIIRAILRAKLIHVLITDENAARALIKGVL